MSERVHYLENLVTSQRFRDKFVELFADTPSLDTIKSRRTSCGSMTQSRWRPKGVDS